MTPFNPHYLGLEIGGTKLQVGVGCDDGRLLALWRGGVDLAAGPAGIRRQIVDAVPEVLAKAGLRREQVRGIGIGFGGPVDDANRTVIKSHQIEGWDGFPLADWVSEAVELPAVLCNDADVAGLGEALHGAGKGLSPIFYITIGSGIGGGLILDGKIYRGQGRGAAEIGHLKVDRGGLLYTLESMASGWGMEERLRQYTRTTDRVPVPEIYQRAESHLGTNRLAGSELVTNRAASLVVLEAQEALALACSHVIALLCPRRIVIGGGVSLLGEKRLFEPLRALVAERCFQPFAGMTDIVPAALGEEVVVHGAIALARQQLG